MSLSEKTFPKIAISPAPPNSRPIRIAFCITELEPGGAEKNLVELVTRLDKAEFDPLVVSLGSEPPPPRSKLVEKLRGRDIRVEFLGANHNWQFPWLLLRLRRLLTQFRPAIIQSMLFHANVASRLAALGLEVRGRFAGVRVAERRNRWHLWLERLTSPLVDSFVCVSDDVARFLKAAGFPPGKLTVIANGVDPELVGAYSPVDWRQFALPSDARVVLFVGRLDPQKAVPELLANAPRWLAHSPQVHLVLVGDGPLRKHLEQQASKLDRSGQVRFLGWQSEVIPFLLASQMLVLPSRWEGMPNVVLEAMAAARPVVATRVEGVCELLGPLADQQTVTPENWQDFGDKILAFLSHPSLAQQVAQANRERVIQHFHVEQMVAKYRELWLSKFPDKQQA